MSSRLVRLWSPPSGRIDLDADGFLFDPGDPFGAEQTLETYESIDGHRCLVLLGEPGIGKTTELEAAVAAAGDRGHHVDLGAVADTEALRRRVVGAPRVEAWRGGDEDLVLFIDAFDEARAERGVLVRALVDELAELPVERLRLRIACRTADWPWTLGDRLKLLFGEDEVREYELQPLRRGDVVAAATAASVDGDAFVAVVAERGAAPLARVPLTLRFLLEQYASGGTLLNRRVDLYREGCRLLCREQNPSRLETGRTGTLSAEQRMAIAERIAAATVVAGRAAVRYEGTGRDATVAELAELDGGSERTSADVVAEASDVDVDQNRLREALATGLFTSRGDSVLGFAHHSYAEFLAARFLHRHRFGVRRVLNLLAQERGGRQRIIPQLRGVAAWLADFDGDFLDWLIANEPEAALGSDLADVADARRATLVGALLARAEAGRLTDVSHRELAKLAHTGLGDQLRRWIIDSGAGPARRLAFQIFGFVGVEELYELVVERILDEDEEMRIRVEAGWALWLKAPAETRAQLRPLAVTPQDADSDDDLKGVALLCVWPESLTVDELLAALTPPKRDHYLGAYGLFLTQELIPRLTDTDLVRMLAWARDVGTVGQHRRFAALIDDTFIACWQRPDSDDLAAAFAAAVATLLPREHRLGAGSYRVRELEQLIRDAQGKRRGLVERLIPVLVEGSLDPYHLVTEAPLVEAGDLGWLLDHALAAQTEAEKRAWARLVDVTFRGPRSFADTDAVLAACEADEVIRATVQYVYGAVELDSPEAEAGREWVARKRELAKEHAGRERQRAEFDAASPARLVAALSRVEAGDIEGYLHLDTELLHKPESNAIERDGGDVRAFPNWQGADAVLRERILQAGERYLASGPLDGQTLSATSIAAYHALRLVHAERGGVDVPATRLGALIPTMLAYPLSGDDDRATAGELLAFAAAQAPDAFIDAVRARAEREAAAHGTIFFLSRLQAVPVGHIDGALCALIREGRLPPHGVAAVLEAVLERGAACGAQLAFELIDARSTGETEADIGVSAAALLLVYTRDREPAARVIEVIGADPSFGKRVIEHVAAREVLRHSVPALPEDLTADLFLFAAREFGWDEEGPTWRDIGSWRSSLLTQLSKAGTEEAHAQLERLRGELPELAFLARVSEDGEARMLAATWRPPDPQTIIVLAASRSQRYVASGDQLLEAVVDGLDLVQRDLNDDPSGARDLWDQRDGGYVPVNENVVSSWLQRRLREKLTGERGIILLREVQIIQPPGTGVGPRTDLHVNAVVQHRNAAPEALTTIVEVKGCWHSDIETALQTQLVDDYLLPTANRYGIYLVVWFESERWANGDQRRRDCARCDRDDTIRALTARARELEDEHGLYLRVVSLTISLL